MQSGASSLGIWGSKIADEDMEENRPRLIRGSVGPNARMTSRGLLGYSRTRVRRTWEEQLASIEQTTRSRWEKVRLCDPLTAVTGAEPIMRKSSAQKAVVAKFDDHLTTEVAESSRRSDHIWASKDMINKLVDVVSLVFSGNVVARSHFNHMED
ncbi:hypothetical protein TIFTF001_026143 [Ficus carica]|uniref:Uncharacterized protein n=1 Tax=Ficus carica TaxID=3494 RepID=A0AA88DKQ2_FICCA|nr:hypothetical protein TIFTF001_026143 [Ficus carica]